jgi:hypothetical protein
MASIFDKDPNNLPPRPKEEEPAIRDKKRQSLTSAEFAAAGRTLLAKVNRAFEVLHEAMDKADYGTAIKAAQIVLDRTGFGPKSTVDVNQTTMDLTNLSKAELGLRAARIAEMLQGRVPPAAEVPLPESKTIQ